MVNVLKERNQELLQDEEISLKDLVLKFTDWWKYLLSKWLIILIVGILGGLLGLWYAINQTPVYTAYLSFALEDEQGGGASSYAGIASQFGFDLGGGGGGGAFSGGNLLELMKSRSMIEKTLLTPLNIDGKNQTLAQFYLDFNDLDVKIDPKGKMTGFIQFLPGDDRTKFTRQQDSLLGVLHRNMVTTHLSVDKIDKNLSIISVKVNSGNELFSKVFTEVLVNEVSDFYVQTKTKKSVDNLSILQFQTDSVRRALNSAISGVAVLLDNNPNPNLARQVLRVPSQKRGVDVQANQAILSEMVKNLEMSKIALRRETPFLQIIDRPILPLETKRYGKLQGLITGGFLAGFLVVFILISARVYSQFKSII